MRQPDHATRMSMRTHTSASVPYLIYDSTVQKVNAHAYTEEDARKSGNFVAEGPKLMDKLVNI